MRRIAVLQPSYLPWLGYLDQIARCDAFVFYDDVQYDKNGWRNRNRIRTNSEEGWGWLTVPVRLPDHFPKINEVEADPRVPWRRKHQRALEMEYAKAEFKSELHAHFGAFFEGSAQNLADIAIESVECLMRAFGIATPLYRSSRLAVEGDRNTRLLAICRKLEATHYLSGVAAQAYLDEGLFRSERIEVEWQNYLHPVYPQLHGPFISHLSAIDALLNLGPAVKGLVGQEVRLA